MKYQLGVRTVKAVYDPAECSNPLLAALPPMLSREVFMSAISSEPPLPGKLNQMCSSERRQLLPILATIFLPLGYSYSIYDTLYRAIATTYRSLSAVDSVRQTNAIFRGAALPMYATQADTGAILGVSGIGKTSTARRVLSLMPQVIEHTNYRERPFSCVQVLYLHVECPCDCSVKTMAFAIIAALDRAIGSEYLSRLSSLRASAASNIAVQVKILCMTHHVGVILVDEIQNAVMTAQKNHQEKPLVKFLVELTNETCTAVFFIGTPEAEALFNSQEHLKRRTRGVRLLPFHPDGSYYGFLERVWRFQITPRTAQLTESMAQKIYDCSGGIPSYILKIFQEAQATALLQGRDCINASLLQMTIERLGFTVPRVFYGGTSISAFETVPEDEPEVLPPVETEVGERKREYAKKRGRKAAPRDIGDILEAFRTGEDVLTFLRNNQMLEEMR